MRPSTGQYGPKLPFVAVMRVTKALGPDGIETHCRRMEKVIRETLQNQMELANRGYEKMD